MNTRMKKLGLGGLALLVGFFSTLGARADVLPEPERPKDWDEHPAPEPDVPDSAARRLVPLLALVMAGGTAAVALRRAHHLTRAGQAR